MLLTDVGLLAVDDMRDAPSSNVGRRDISSALSSSAQWRESGGGRRTVLDLVERANVRRRALHLREHLDVALALASLHVVVGRRLPFVRNFRRTDEMR